MNKEEIDKIENVYHAVRIPCNDPMDARNEQWWKLAYSEDSPAIKNMLKHEIAFVGTRPVAVKSIYKGEQILFVYDHFDAMYKLIKIK